MSEQRTIDTPNDIAMRQEQARVRLEQGRSIAGHPTRLAKPEFNPSFTFRFRQYRTTQFSGLWELAAIGRDGKVEEIITDADSLPEVLEAIGNIFANKGY